MIKVTDVGSDYSKLHKERHKFNNNDLSAPLSFFRGREKARDFSFRHLIFCLNGNVATAGYWITGSLFFL
jgi:hypothetical protein